ncbi:histidine phosphatase family protein [Gymnodinialimonas hymeniacidonis]|uniref:histidine phosphatase family protein n=1 Tax=Gymnodinialimonas hymeniacidonis TaxID=3126508 RepID=UPI0034C65AE1
MRHGPTHQKTFTGWRDVPADLSDSAAIARLADWLPADAPIISSDLKRAVATADAIAAGRRRLPHASDLREFNFGDWDGVHFTQVAATHPELSRAFWEEPGDIAPPNGESWNAVTRRVARTVDDVLARHDGDLVCVAHFGVILCHMAHATGMSPYEALGHKIDPLSATMLVQTDGTWQAEHINHAP